MLGYVGGLCSPVSSTVDPHVTVQLCVSASSDQSDHVCLWWGNIRVLIVSATINDAIFLPVFEPSLCLHTHTGSYRRPNTSVVFVVQVRVASASARTAKSKIQQKLLLDSK